MQLRQVTIERFRGIEHLRFEPGRRTVILGPNNAGKSTVLEALDLLLHPGFGRPRVAPEEVEYFKRDPSAEFRIEAVIGELTADFRADVLLHLEGWHRVEQKVVPEPDGQDIEAIVRVQVRGTSDFEILHEYAKTESAGARFNPAVRLKVGWVFDGHSRDPARQLAFYQGGLLDKLFGNVELAPVIQGLKDALGVGATAVNQHTPVDAVLHQLAEDLYNLGLLPKDKIPAFEAGAMSRRELLQTLRLDLPSPGDILIPIDRQGRGTQRLALVSILLRLASLAGRNIIGGFEEPEEALEPLRQAQVARMLVGIADRGGQVLVVTHSPEIVRQFQIDDLLILPALAAGGDIKSLSTLLTPPVRQTYERQLDGPIVRGLFARLPVLVEGPGDRAVFEAFWEALVKTDELRPAAELGLDMINCEGSPFMPMLASVLHTAGKNVVAWCERDTSKVLETVERLRSEAHCGALLLYSLTAFREKLEGALAFGCSSTALGEAMTAIAVDRDYSWEDQRADLVSRCDGFDEATRDKIKSAMSIAEVFAVCPEVDARVLCARALAANRTAPFDLKGARQGRIFAETIAESQGVPVTFGQMLRDLQTWVQAGCPNGTEILMGDA